MSMPITICLINFIYNKNTRFNQSINQSINLSLRLNSNCLCLAKSKLLHYSVHYFHLPENNKILKMFRSMFEDADWRRQSSGQLRQVLTKRYSICFGWNHSLWSLFSLLFYALFSEWKVLKKTLSMGFINNKHAFQIK